jgi:hypothetical protein
MRKPLTLSKRVVVAILFAASTTLTGGEEKISPEYLKPPAYDRAMRLADGLAIADLVVSGIPTADGRMQVREVLFGKPEAELAGEDGSLRLVKYPRTDWGKSGAWLLVRTHTGYLAVNPGTQPLSLDEYQNLKRPDDHWTQMPKLSATKSGSHQLYHVYPKPEGGSPTWHGSNSYASQGDTTVELNQHGDRVFRATWNQDGELKSVSRYPQKRYGFFMDLDGEQVTWFVHFLDRQHHGLQRRHYDSHRDPPRFEKHFRRGVIDGLSREWDRNGKLVKETKFESGLIPPIVRYQGDDKGKAGVIPHSGRDGVSYQSVSAAAAKIKVGMTTQQVSEIVKVDFSPASGIHFPTYGLDSFLHIAFKDGKVSAITTGHNGICLELAPNR